MSKLFIMSQRKNATFSIDEITQNQFKGECSRNGSKMSTVIETYMSEYVRLSRKLHSERENG